MATPFEPSPLKANKANEVENEDLAPSFILKVWHPEHFEISNGQLDKRVTSFKTLMIASDTKVSEVCSKMAGKLGVNDPARFGLTIVKGEEIKGLGADDMPSLIIQNAKEQNQTTEVKFAYLPIDAKLRSATHVGDWTSRQDGILQYEVGALKWQPVSGALTHRRLLNDSRYEMFADVLYKFKQQNFFSFHSIISVRCPQLLTHEYLVKKKKERKIAAGGVFIGIEVNEDKIAYDTLLQIFDFVYTGNLEFQSLPIETILRVHIAATKLGIDRLTWLCEHYVEANLFMDNVFEILRCADTLKVAVVKKFCFDFAFSNWDKVIVSREGINLIGMDLFQELTVAKTQTNAPLSNRASDGNISNTDKENDNEKDKEKEKEKEKEKDKKGKKSKKEKKTNSAPSSPSTELKRELSKSDGGKSKCTIVDDFKTLLTNMPYPDAVASFMQGEVKFHRCILAAHDDTLLQYLVESRSNSAKDSIATYEFPGITADQFKCVLQMIYQGNSSDVAAEGAVKILEWFVMMFKVPLIRDQCEGFLCEKVDIKSVLEILRITYHPISNGRTHITKDLREYCLNFICDNFGEVDLKPIKQAQVPQLSTDLLLMAHARFGDEMLGKTAAKNIRRKSSLRFA